jgi:DNA-binding transcriptional ArsR family regulator|tara:strand:+ start:4991 stop:5422 length:432 start_codon:yes stop_codon:yes gene_type:complete
MDECMVEAPLPKEGVTDPLQKSLFGTSAHKLSRTADPQTSHDAARSIDTTRLEELVYETIRDAGPRGIISDEVRQALAGRDLSYSSVTARYAALREKGLVEYSGHRRPGDSGRGQNILVATYWRAEDEARSLAAAKCDTAISQ